VSVHVATQLAAGGGAAGLVGNVVVGGVVGMAADAATGAALKHVPNPVPVELVRPQQPAPFAPGVASRRRPDQKLR
jgi:hypothetical protein